MRIHEFFGGNIISIFENFQRLFWIVRLLFWRWLQRFTQVVSAFHYIIIIIIILMGKILSSFSLLLLLRSIPEIQTRGCTYYDWKKKRNKESIIRNKTHTQHAEKIKVLKSLQCAHVLLGLDTVRIICLHPTLVVTKLLSDIRRKFIILGRAQSHEWRYGGLQGLMRQVRVTSK
ncbi:hypothetical protein BC937DRAFT_92035 [Endogone sp. FLAS-F59071]|nr:hypothetical protein BC937DRAFT_92035 [Endogone sp. FLAS-F59071]|eukprot:RUS15754.1 hypothetical protein BC937DRAFT_92035 [Endogone sp. FLAS-F59071]